MKESKKKERRQAQRYPYKQSIKYAALGNPFRPPDTSSHAGEVVNLSNGGIRIRTTQNSIQKRLVLKIGFPVFNNDDIHIPVLAEVRWAVKKRPGTLEAGLMFMA